MPTSPSNRHENVRRYRARMRALGFRQIQDVGARQPPTRFPEECRRQPPSTAMIQLEQGMSWTSLKVFRTWMAGDHEAWRSRYRRLAPRFRQSAPGADRTVRFFQRDHPSLTVLPLTSEVRSAPQFRIVVEPSATNGLRRISQIMVDKPMTFRREKNSSLGSVHGRPNHAQGRPRLGRLAGHRLRHLLRNVVKTKPAPRIAGQVAFLRQCAGEAVTDFQTGGWLILLKRRSIADDAHDQSSGPRVEAAGEAGQLQAA